MNIQDAIDAWNEQADEFNQWDALGSNEQVEFAMKFCRSPQDGRAEESRLINLLAEKVKEHTENGCYDMSKSLGIRTMPSGYALMLNADKTHFYYVKYDGEESVIHWDKWAVYQWAKNDLTHDS